MKEYKAQSLCLYLCIYLLHT